MDGRDPHRRGSSLENFVTKLRDKVQSLTENPVEDGRTPMAAFIPQIPGTNTRAQHIFRNPAASSSDSIDPFQPIATVPPPANIQPRDNHPVPRLNITSQDGPLHTNKFYANLFLGSQRQGAWTHPYSVSWSGGGGSCQSWGLAISHIDPHLRAYGPPNNQIPGAPASFVINPIGIQSLIMSARELGKDTVLSTDNLEGFSVNAMLKPSHGSTAGIEFPLVQGMGFVTGRYKQLQPVIESGVLINSFAPVGSPRDRVFKYRIKTEDQKEWLLYAIPEDRTFSDLSFFAMRSNSLIEGPKGWSGVLQIAKNPAGAAGEVIYDQCAGLYAASAELSGTVQRYTGHYTFKWATKGTGTSLLMFALPHHKSSFDRDTANRLTIVTLSTTTKGNATAVIGSSWTMVEPTLATDMGFAPWSPNKGPVTTLSVRAISAIQGVGAREVNQDMHAQSNLDSFYFAGKALSKFATMVWTLKNLANSPDHAAHGLASLKAAFARWTSNRNQRPLVYDTSWKGVVSSAWADVGADFGNSVYNDHHFHFGYFLHAAAMIGSMDAAWLADNKAYINTMARDVSNPSKADRFFPVFRSFDWFHGHSFAKGLFESADGKDEESSSEDVMFAYALKMWGHTVGDKSMEARGNLMLAVLARTLPLYFLTGSENAVQPREFAGNKVTGILFENKIDHVTYFGANLEYVQGIHMLPLLPPSIFTRPQRFVAEEWDQYFAEGGACPASRVAGGWRGILYANLALVDPMASFSFFNHPNFDEGFLDGGASRTWYLAFAAGLGGA